MKYFTIFTILLLSLSAREDIENFLRSNLKKQNLELHSLKILDRVPIDEIEGFEKVDFEYTYIYRKDRQIIVSEPFKKSLFSNREFVAEDFLNTKNAESLKNNLIEDFKRNQDLERLRELAKSENSSIEININPHLKIYKPKVAIFIDPENIENSDLLIDIDNLANRYILKIIFTPFISNDSLKKSAFIATNLKEINKPDRKLYMLKKYLFQKQNINKLRFDFNILSNIKNSLREYDYLKQLKLPYLLELENMKKEERE